MSQQQNTRAGDDKSRLVKDVFDTVASRYDLMNDLMSGGLHRAWKTVMIEWLAPPRGARPYQVIDVAGGTGDIALRLLERAGSGAHVTVCDINPAMTGEGAVKAEAAGFGRRTDFVTGNAETLPFPDQNFDAYTIAFGIRNVSHIDRALAEAHRALKPGGRFLCLEFSKVDTPLLDTLYETYSDRMIPAIGAMVVGEAGPYQYLVDSIRRFPSREDFAAMIREAGFSRVTWRVLSGGIVAIHSGWRL